MKKRFIVLFLIVAFLGFLFFLWFPPRYVVPILMYHSVDNKAGTFFVSPENFAKQMEYIKKNGYEVITLDELVRSIKDKKHLKGNKVVITFDDGYKDNFINAYPVLKKYQFSATIFLITDFIDKNPAFLSWSEVRIMSKDKISFGGHTKTHFYLGSMLDEKNVFDELAGSKKAIEQQINTPADYFCYPGGGFNERVKSLVVQAGYKGACATNRGFADFNSDVYELKRIKVTNSDTNKPFSFWAKLSGYYNLFRKEKNPY